MKRSITVILFLIVLTFIDQNICTAISPDSFVWTKNLKVASEEIRGITYGNSKYVAVGDDGYIIISTDMAKWERIDSVTVEDIQDIIWAGDRFFAVSRKGTVLNSVDGIIWNTKPLGEELNLEKMCFCNKIYIILSNSKYYFTSSDGIKWRKVETSNTITSITWDGKNYIASSYDDKTGRVLISHDTENWTETYTCDGKIKEILYEKNKYVGVGGGDYNGFILSSSDGISWIKRFETEDFTNVNGVIWDGSGYLAYGYFGSVLYSTDGIKWMANNLIDEEYIQKMVNLNNNYIYIDIYGQVKASKDLTNWETKIESINTKYNDVIWDGNKFLVIGEHGTILTSYDSHNWIKTEIGKYKELLGIAYSNKKYVICFYNWETQKIEIITSMDGIKWIDSSVSIESLPGASIISDGKSFLMYASSGRIFKSNDGNKWSSYYTKDFYKLDDIVWNGSEFTALGDSTKILSSKDGIKWSLCYETKECRLNSVIWNGEMFIAVGDTENGTNIYTSTTGDKWTKFTSLDQTYSNKIQWDGKRYITVGLRGEIRISEDLKIWYKLKSNTNNHLCNLEWNGKIYIAVGDSGTILTTEPIDILKISVKSKPIKFNAAPIEKDGEYLVTGDELFNALGIKVEYNKKSKLYKLKKDKTVIEMTVGSKEAIVNGKKTKLEEPISIINGHYYIPFKFLINNFDLKYAFDQNSRILDISK